MLARRPKTEVLPSDQHYNNARSIIGLFLSEILRPRALIECAPPKTIRVIGRRADYMIERTDTRSGVLSRDMFTIHSASDCGLHSQLVALSSVDAYQNIFQRIANSCPLSLILGRCGFFIAEITRNSSWGRKGVLRDLSMLCVELTMKQIHLPL